ncbi:kelch-like protein 9-like [Planoprotostelium fungivorum]|uniref:Kelch-like protein 9-like n=1 Tax=Planoprotostelium fungivorum TaxID=1890364 RepID=A0A2P6NEK8_9EUKA|nr:kelch-like protein 9-like [Planoprotostelium fungivorum]
MLVGGRTAGNLTVSTMLLYSGTTWRESPLPGNVTAGFSVCANDTHGFISQGSELFTHDAAASSWSSQRTPRYRVDGACAVNSGQIIIAGGRDEAEEMILTANVYDVSTSTWSDFPTTAKSRPSIGVLSSDEIAIMGGSPLGSIDQLFLFNKSKGWTNESNLTGTFPNTLFAFNGSLIVSLASDLTPHLTNATSDGTKYSGLAAVSFGSLELLFPLVNSPSSIKKTPIFHPEIVLPNAFCLKNFLAFPRPWAFMWLWTVLVIATVVGVLLCVLCMSTCYRPTRPDYEEEGLLKESSCGRVFTSIGTHCCHLACKSIISIQHQRVVARISKVVILLILAGSTYGIFWAKGDRTSATIAIASAIFMMTLLFVLLLVLPLSQGLSNVLQSTCVLITTAVWLGDITVEMKRGFLGNSQNTTYMDTPTPTDVDFSLASYKGHTPSGQQMSETEPKTSGETEGEEE